jgi:lipopolysaccharide/colanic/teichoic acid biosynthesis glycosyltransferase
MHLHGESILSIAPDPVLKPHLQLKRPDISGPSRLSLELLAKSAFDRLTALIALLMVAPVMLGIAALILLRRDGPVFFSHDRVGRDGRMFRCHKFRTMVPNGARLFDRMLAIDPIASEDWLVRRKVYRDPRVSRLGAFLRSTSLDELPQLWNVLKGDMSMVGPRPITVEELAKYGDNARDYLSVRPGITGAWQVSGRSECTYAERVALDVDYIRNLSFSRDMSILLRTVDVVLRRQGAS